MYCVARALLAGAAHLQDDFRPIQRTTVAITSTEFVAAAAGRISAAHAALIAGFYTCFNERRIEDAAAMFVDDAIVEHAAVHRTVQGGKGYLLFAQMWCQGFPDASVAVERVSPRGEGLYEIDLLAQGTHLGNLDLGGGWLFRATGASASLRMRQLLQIESDRFTCSTLSFDLQDIIQQLVTVDEQRLIELTRKIHSVGEALASARTFVERRDALQRVGVELDEARHVLRPYYKR